jgi:tetratricopeptide (TPR) repeat protein
VYYDVLTRSRLQAGDAEAAIRAGLEAITLYRAADQATDVAILENELAMVFVSLGNLDRAADLATRARSAAEAIGDRRLVGHILDTQAGIALMRGDPKGAEALTDRSLAIEAEIGPPFEQIDTRITRARALAALGRTDEADAAWREAAEGARGLASPFRRKRILSAYAEALAAQGRHAEAYEVMRETI